MRNILFIVNPVAGGGKPKETIPLIKKYMELNGTRYKVIETKEPMEAIEISEKYAQEYNTIVAVGGDGTINEVAKGLIRAKTGVLGIIPSGTGNDISKSLGISQNPEESLQAIINNNIKSMDIGLVNGLPFLNIASIGFDAETVKNTNRVKRILKGKAAYIIGVLVTLLSYRSRYISFTIDEKEYSRKFLLIAVGNGSFYGGGMKILPMAKIDDGYFHICIVKNISNFKALFLFPTIFKGNHLKYEKYIEIFKVKRIIIKNEKNTLINLDGELIVNKNEEVIFEFFNDQLNVISNSFKY